ncbi:helix-turn-helix domain-containing protein [Nocardia sp. R7R-8]|uniref:helix-turn-helix domain-containing protein n=1 Tax=Nocardia sp. R7R-8 TaxID=3459304 RepID=UPI00403D7340
MGVGERTARARKLARLTQTQLAHKANVSLSLLRKVEQGDRPASPAFIAAVARALGVNVEDLTGQPYSPQPADSTAHATIRELRRRILAFTDEPLTRPTSLEKIAAALNRVREGMRRAQYSDLTAELPDVIHGLHVSSLPTRPPDITSRRLIRRLPTPITGHRRLPTGTGTSTSPDWRPSVACGQRNAAATRCGRSRPSITVR